MMISDTDPGSGTASPLTRRAPVLVPGPTIQPESIPFWMTFVAPPSVGSPAKSVSAHWAKFRLGYNPILRSRTEHWVRGRCDGTQWNEAAKRRRQIQQVEHLNNARRAARRICHQKNVDVIRAAD